MAPKERKIRGAKADKMTPKDPLTAEQKAVAKWLRRNVPTKKTKFMHSHTVEYFAGYKAVDMLMEDSPFTKKNVKDPETQFHFEFREQAVEFCDELLKHKMFHRAKKIQVDEKFLKKSKKSSKETEGENTAEESTEVKATASGSGGSNKKKRKIRCVLNYLDFTPKAMLEFSLYSGSFVQFSPIEKTRENVRGQNWGKSDKI